MSDNITREELIRGLQELDDAERREVIAEASSREAGMQRAATALRNFNHPTRKD